MTETQRARRLTPGEGEVYSSISKRTAPRRGKRPGHGSKESLSSDHFYLIPTFKF